MQEMLVLKQRISSNSATKNVKYVINFNLYGFLEAC